MSDNSRIAKVLEWARKHAGPKAANETIKPDTPLPQIARLIQNRFEKPNLSGGAIWVWLFENPKAAKDELRRAFPKKKWKQLETEYWFYAKAMERIPQDLISTTAEFENRSFDGQEEREISEAMVSPKAGTETNTDTVIQDLSSVMDDTEIGETERLTLLSARVGQGLFRDKVIKMCGGKCVVTDYVDASFLIASHIRPWRESDNRARLDGHNGLLLTPNLDKAFDKGLISFEDDGRILISPDFEGQSKKLGISHEMKASLKPGHKPYLALHRRKYFANG